MEHSYDEWITSANEALEVSLVQAAPTSLRTVASFHPRFTYSIFGDEETIIGYKNLQIQLRYHASDMRPNLHVSYSKKIKAVGDKEPIDVSAVLKDFLPAVAFQKPTEFESAIRQVQDGDYTPPGTRIRSFETGDGRYEIWRGSLSDAAVKQLVDRIQIFVPLFIEGGTFISTDGSDPADRWSLYFLYRTRQMPGSANKYAYEFAGYSTVYRFLLPVGVASCRAAAAVPTTAGDAELELLNTDSDGQNDEPKFSLSNLPCRSRLSQFVVLPPFQGKGNAGRLYRTIYEDALQDPHTVEMTVEDPNEAFDDVRDLADLASLSAHPLFKAAAKINTKVDLPRTGASPRNIVPTDELEKVRVQLKLAPRQFLRVLEMYLMQKLTPSLRPNLDQDEDEDDEEREVSATFSKGKGKTAVAAPTKEQQQEYRLWRLLVKQRLYRHNKEILGQLERSQRIEKLEETLGSVELEYARILSIFESRVAKFGAAAAADKPSLGKRKLEEEDAMDDGESVSSKKARMEEA